MAFVNTKKSALVITALLSLAFGAPGIQHVLPDEMHAEDSFPISTFPMFSRARPELHRMTWVRAIDVDSSFVARLFFWFESRLFPRHSASNLAIMRLLVGG